MWNAGFPFDMVGCAVLIVHGVNDKRSQRERITNIHYSLDYNKSRLHDEPI